MKIDLSKYQKVIIAVIIAAAILIAIRYIINKFGKRRKEADLNIDANTGNAFKYDFWRTAPESSLLSENRLTEIVNDLWSKYSLKTEFSLSNNPFWNAKKYMFPEGIADFQRQIKTLANQAQVSQVYSAYTDKGSDLISDVKTAITNGNWGLSDTDILVQLSNLMTWANELPEY